MIKRLIMVFAVIFIYTLGITQAQTHNWVRTNPGGGGAFSTIEAGPGGIILAGSDLSGAYISYDHGQSWEVIGASKGLTETHVSGLGFNPDNSSVFYIGTENGIFRSNDGGKSVSKVLSSGYITDIKFSKSNPNTGYAAYHPFYDSGNGVIYKSTDNGLSWSQISTGLPNKIRILKIVVDPSSENTVYILTGEGRFACSSADVYKSTNGGINWSNITTGFPAILDFAVDENNPDKIYVTTMHADCDSVNYWYDLYGSLFKSNDGGENWSGPLSAYTGVILLDPADSNVIRLIDPREPYPWNPRSGTFTSTDGGITFTKTGDVNNWDTFFNHNVYWSYSSSYNGICKTIGRDMSNPDNFYWVTNQWCFGSFDGGTTFNNLFTDEVKPGFWRSRGFDNVNMMDISISKANPGIIYAAYFDIGIWRSLDNGESWQSCNDSIYTGGWEGFGGNCATILADPSRPNVVWASQSENQNGEYPTHLLKNENTGDRGSWVRADAGLPAEEIMGLSLDENSNANNRTLYVTAQGDVYKSTDDGATWAKVFDCDGCRFTAVDKFNGNIVYAGGEKGVWRSVDGGNTWTDVSLPGMRSDNGAAFWDWNYNGVFDIETDPNNPDVVFVTVFGENKGLYRSRDNGTNWDKILTDDFMRKVAIVPQNSNLIYATSSSAFQAGGYDADSKGILFSQDGGQNWTQVNTNMAYPFALAIDVSNAPQPVVFVGSPGTGFQKSNVPSVSSVKEAENIPDKIMLYPNPAHNLINIKTKDDELKKVKVYNVLGEDITSRIKINKLSKGNAEIDLSDLTVGIYIVRISSTSFKVIKK